MSKIPNIVCVGGGTGTFVTLKGLKNFPVHLSSIVSMSDSGGSNRRIRDEFGLLPTSDIRQCLVALSEENGGVGLLRKLFMYRFEKGNGISGMTFGNLFMAALTDILGSQEAAIRQTGKVLRIHGTVIPVSFTKNDLYAKYEDGHILNEEHLIDEPAHDGKLKIIDVFLKPQALANPKALEAIALADTIILGPGDLFTSIIPNLLVENVAESIKKSKAKVIFIMNLMTKFGQTYNYTAHDHIKSLEKFLDKRINIVIMNSGNLCKVALEKYAKYQEFPVVDDLDKIDKPYFQVVRAQVASRVSTKKASNDLLVRSLIRHDSKKLAEVLMSIKK